MKFTALFFSTLVIFNSGCMTSRRQHSPALEIERESATNSLNDLNSNDEAVSTPQTKPLVIVTSPGLARTFAFVGVLRAFNKLKIPIQAFVVNEMSAVLCGLYLDAKNMNEFEWKLYRVNDTLLETAVIKKGLFVRLLGSKPSFSEWIDQLFQIPLEGVRIPTLVLAPASAETWIESGTLANAIRRSFDSYQDVEITTVLESIRSDALNSIRDRFSGPIVYLDFLEGLESEPLPRDQRRAEYLTRLLEIRRKLASIRGGADLLIGFDYPEVSLYDFKSRNTFAYEGERKALKLGRELQILAGVKID